MSSVPSPATITYEQMMALFRKTQKQMKETRLAFQETDRKFQETDRKFQEAERRFQETERFMKESNDKLNQSIARLGSCLGELLESMVEGGVVRLFQELGYSFETCNRRIAFKNKTLDIYGEIDLFLENGEFALLVEVKTNLSIDDIKEHVKRLEKYRVYADARNDKRQFIAAVGGGVIQKNVRDFALKQGTYVVQQSGENLEIISPEGKPKVW